MSTDDDRVFWSMWLQHEAEIYRCCLRWMGNRPDAEDAWSAAMLRAKAKAKQSKIDNERAWLRQLAKNLCIDLHRQRGRRAVVCGDFDAIAPSGDGEYGPGDPVNYALQAELITFCWEAIAALPSKLREVMVLWVEEDCSYGEIGERLGLSTANVRKRVSQARAILRRRLAEYERGVKHKNVNQ
ncbi:RNA polymerase sigma factor [Spirulina major]|uniref:RNA polymerase sigma factor n=1 Tax=Spirulina major TaxID=270636 RepID=UPI0009333AAA|nr:RNA polymerase sigma factor [Spirulina major]